MKSVTIIYNGAADQPVSELADRSPLEVIRAENASRIATAGQAGMLDLSDYAAGTGHQLLAELSGVSPDIACALNRGPLWASSLNEDFAEYDFAYCANFVTLDEEDRLTGPRVVHLSFEETRSLAQAVEEGLGGEVRVCAVAPSQAVLLCRTDGIALHAGSAPVTETGTRADKYFARFKKDSQRVAEWMRCSIAALAGRSVNEVRVDLGENPATLLWLWEGGPLVPAPVSMNGNTLLLTNSPMASGLAIWGGIPVLPLKDPWNMESDEEVFHLPDVVRLLREKDRLIIYAESPGCGGTFASLTEKLRMLESIDYRLLIPLKPILEANRPYRIFLLSDSVVSTESGRSVKGSVPVVVAGEGIPQDEVLRWSETDCLNGTLGTVSRSVLRHMIGV